PTAPSFRQDVIPVLTKMGCNAGSCHGKMAGQNGFKLSLRGYAPEWDYDSLTTELGSRRIDFGEPDQSLLLRKPLGQVPHEGGRRFAEGSAAQKVLLEWIKARAPGPDPKEQDADRLDVLPGDRMMHIGETQQLAVRAHYPDGRLRDVTWLSQFFANDPAIVSVSEDGLVKSLRSGSTAVRVHFQGLVGVVTLTTPFDNTVEPSQFSQANNLLDPPVMARLAALHVPPSGVCDDATFVRRAFLDTIGALPTPNEVRAFLADGRSNKRAALIDALLDRPEFADYWALQLGDLLQNRRERDHDARGVKGVRALHEWLREQVARNRPWDELAREVLTCTGDAAHHPAIGYFIVTIGEKQNVEESEVADSVAQAFLGTRIGCARCHNHPLEKYTQDDFYHFAACFSHMTFRRAELGKGTTYLLAEGREQAEAEKQLSENQKALAETQAIADSKTGDEQKKALAKIEELENRQNDLCANIEGGRLGPQGVRQPRTGKFMVPQPLDRSPIATDSGQDARVALAAWITDPKNEYFSGAMVNRLWKHFLGVGIVEPVDDLRSSNPPSNPALWAVLNQEFVSHHYDLKHVIRLILNSRTYQLSSTTLAENEKDHHFFSHYYARRLPAEVMADAIVSATGVPDHYAGYPVGQRAVELPEPGVNSYFLTLFGRSDRITACACERNDEVNLPQLLNLNNGDDVLNKIRSGEGRLAKIMKNVPDDTRAVDEVFLAAFGRPPSDGEKAAVHKALAAGDPREEVYRDLLWALLNSKEFAFNH
ncbi:MAG TPA: DUF1549 domain-containing protein, partial [Tepidisphaeraceae bacterium]|nr:DUF1549 domain-containing protein [Tepidisphaeraceae bacterium]